MQKDKNSRFIHHPPRVKTKKAQSILAKIKAIKLATERTLEAF
jgi:hypothetical protein